MQSRVSIGPFNIEDCTHDKVFLQGLLVTLVVLWILRQLATAIYSFLFNESPPPLPHVQTTIYIIIIESVDISTTVFFYSCAVQYHKILHGTGVIAWVLLHGPWGYLIA